MTDRHGTPIWYELLTKDPFGAGWMIKVRVADATELSKLLDHAAYQAHCEAEKH